MRIKRRRMTYGKYTVKNNINSVVEIEKLSKRLGEQIYIITEQTNGQYLSNHKGESLDSGHI